MKRTLVAMLVASGLRAATLPAGTELNIRLLDKVASEASAPKTTVSAVVIIPVLLNDAVLIPAGTQLEGVVASAKAAGPAERARLELSFTEISKDAYKTKLSAIVAGLDNSRESVDDNGVITGIDASQTFSSRLNQGIAKLGSSDRFAALASIIQGAKQVLKIGDANPNIDYEAGTELTVRLTGPLDWRGPVRGPEAALRPFSNEAALADMVNRQPFRTTAADPPRPSDLTNLLFIGTEADMRSAFEKAGWSTAAQLSGVSKLETARAVIEDRGYKEGPMSILLLDDRPPDMSWQKGNNTFAQRHHLRIFRRPGAWSGKPIWVCSATHDIGIEFSDRDATFIHKIDPLIDKERAKVVSDLLFTGMVTSLELVDRPNVPLDATNATGDRLETDGRMAVLMF